MQNYCKKIKEELNREKNGRQRIFTRKNISISQVKVWAKHIAINLNNLNKATISIKQEFTSNIQELREDNARQQEITYDLVEPRKLAFH